MNRPAFAVALVTFVVFAAVAYASPVTGSPVLDSPLPTPPAFDPHATYDVYVDCVNWVVTHDHTYIDASGTYHGEDILSVNMNGAWAEGQTAIEWENDVRWWYEGSIVVSHDGGTIERPCVAWLPVVVR